MGSREKASEMAPQLTENFNIDVRVRCGNTVSLLCEEHCRVPIPSRGGETLRPYGTQVVIWSYRGCG
jgi:hypothetical protein